MATLSRVSEIRRNSCQKDKNARSESDLKQILLIDSDDTTHYRPAIPGVVSTSRWKESRNDLREREEKILEQRKVYRLQTVDHGQVVKYEGDRPVETAKSGILRVGTHSKYGFGGLRMKPVALRPDQCKNSEKNGKTTE